MDLRRRLHKAIDVLFEPDPAPDPAPPLPAVPTSFVFEVVERANDRLLDRLDSLDGFFVALMAAVLAVALLAIDKFRLLGWYVDVYFGWFAITALAGSFALCVVGWLRGNNVFGRTGDPEEQDAPIPSRFIWGVANKGEQALVDTIQALEAIFRSNLPIKAYKKRFAQLALLLLALGTVGAGVAKVVYLEYGDSGKPGSESIGGPDRTEWRYPDGRIGPSGILYLWPSDRSAANWCRFRVEVNCLADDGVQPAK